MTAEDAIDAPLDPATEAFVRQMVALRDLLVWADNLFVWEPNELG